MPICCQIELQYFEVGVLKSISILTSLLGLCMPAAAQQQKIDILTIWDQFTVSNAIASKCIKPEKDKLARFLANYQIVSTHAAMRLKESSPTLSPIQIDQIMKNRYAEIENIIIPVISHEGCGSSKIIEALRRFDVQSEIDFAR